MILRIALILLKIILTSDCELYKALPDAPWYFWTPEEEWNSDIEIIRHRLALDQPVLTEMIPVIRRVEDIRVLKFTQLLQLKVYLKIRTRKPVGLWHS